MAPLRKITAKNSHPVFTPQKVLHLFTVLAFCAFATWLGLVASAPYSSAKRWHEANERLYKELQHLRLQNQQRELQLQTLQTPAGIERAARELGYLRPGEHLLRLPVNSSQP